MHLFVIDFDGTIFRSPVPHPGLGGDWVEWLQGATVEGAGLGWFQEPETLGAGAGVSERPDADDYIASTIDVARAAHAAGHHVMVLTGRSDDFLPRIRDILAHVRFPHHSVCTKRDLLVGTVKFKCDEIGKVVRRLGGAYPDHRSGNYGSQYQAEQPLLTPDQFPALGDPVASLSSATRVTCGPAAAAVARAASRRLECLELYDDRPEQLTRMAERLRASFPHLAVREHLVAAPLRFVPTAELENRLMWRVLQNARQRVGPPRVFAGLDPASVDAVDMELAALCVAPTQAPAAVTVIDPAVELARSLCRHEHLAKFVRARHPDLYC